jgi:hypothetical protein
MRGKRKIFDMSQRNPPTNNRKVNLFSLSTDTLTIILTFLISSDGVNYLSVITKGFPLSNFIPKDYIFTIYDTSIRLLENTFSLSYIRNLHIISNKENIINSLEGITQLTKLRRLNVCCFHNSAEEEIMWNIAELTQLQELNLRGNFLTSQALHKHIPKLCKLEVLSLEYLNSEERPVIAKSFKGTHLRSLTLKHFSLTGGLLLHLNKLTYLDISKCDVDMLIMGSIAIMSSLTTLYLTESRHINLNTLPVSLTHLKLSHFDNTQCQAVIRLTCLTKLEMSSCSTSSTFLNNLALLPRLTILIYKDKTLSQLSTIMPNLTELDISRSRLDNFNFSAVPNLLKLTASRCSGFTNSHMRDLSSLTDFIASNLTGANLNTVMRNIHLFSSLTSLDLSYNSFTRDNIKIISNLTSLIHLDISSSDIQIDNTISMHLAKLTKLVTLNLENRFVVDTTFLSSLTKLNIDDYNRLSGKKK